MCVYHNEHKKDSLKKSLIYRFLNQQISRKELHELHDEVNSKEDKILDSIEKDWEDFQSDVQNEWPEKYWSELQKMINNASSEDQSSKVFRLRWVARIAASLLVIASAWFVFDRQKSTEIPRG